MRDRSGKRSNSSLKALVVIIAVGVGNGIGSFLAESAAQTVDRPLPAIVSVADQIAPVITAITIQDTEGTSEADLDLDALKGLEHHMVQTTLRRARAHYAKQGFDATTFDPKVDVGSVYVVVGGKKLAVIRMSIDSRVRFVWVMGFHRAQFLRVSCIRGSDHDIPIFSGDCGTKVTEAFGVSIKPQVGTTAAAPPTGARNLDTQMIEAARSGNLSAVTALVEKGADVNARTSFGYSALSGSSGKGHTEVVRFLLDKGVDVNERLRNGTNALDEASFWGHLGTVRLLLARGANPRVKKDNGYTPVMSAAMNGHLAIVKVLIEHGADVNARNQSGSTALHAATVQGHTAVIDLLLKHGAEPNIRNDAGYTYKDLLARTGRVIRHEGEGANATGR